MHEISRFMGRTVPGSPSLLARISARELRSSLEPDWLQAPGRPSGPCMRASHTSADGWLPRPVASGAKAVGHVLS